MTQGIRRDDVRRHVGGETTQLAGARAKSKFEEFHLPSAGDLPLGNLETESPSILDPARPLIVYWWESDQPNRLSGISGSARRAVVSMGRRLMPSLWAALRFGVVRTRRAGWVGAAVVGLILAAIVAGSVLASVGPPSNDPIMSSSATHGATIPATLLPAGVVVPKTQGLTVRKAMAKLSAAGLGLLRVEAVLGRPGVVMESRPAPGHRASPGMAVVLFVGVPPDRVQRRAG